MLACEIDLDKSYRIFFFVEKMLDYLQQMKTKKEKRHS